MTQIHLAKLHATGNDFLVRIALDSDAPALSGDTVAKLCDRHLGIGADGLITINVAEADDPFREKMRKKLAEGYLATASRFLNRAEKSLIAFSVKLITFEIGIRFLTDFLSGDTYFRIHRPDHNLDRCRTQFKLVESIERQEKLMQKYVDGL